MNKCVLRISLLFFTLCLIFTTGTFVLAQQQSAGQDAEYTKVATQRANKIVVSLGLTDPAKVNKVRDIIAGQYRSLNNIQQEKDSKVKEAKQAAGDDKKAAETKVKEIEDAADAKVAELHKTYLSNLSRELNPEQVDKVKDGMTYNVLPITYKGYQEMLPNLTEKQKAQILAYLTEAREHAIDAGSSEMKHWWFGKYKGRINNYLSAEGIDTKTAREVWEKKLKEQEGAKQ